MPTEHTRKASGWTARYTPLNPWAVKFSPAPLRFRFSGISEPPESLTAHLAIWDMFHKNTEPDSPDLKGGMDLPGPDYQIKAEYGRQPAQTCSTVSGSSTSIPMRARPSQGRIRFGISSPRDRRERVMD